MNQEDTQSQSSETVSAGMLPPWTVGDLPKPPSLGWRTWTALLGPGVLMAGASIGSGEWLAGAPNPEGEGVVPNITPGGPDIAGWSASDIAYYLESGFTPDFDSVGGPMVDVQKNMAELTASDREAIATYLKAVPERPNGY